MLLVNILKCRFFKSRIPSKLYSRLCLFVWILWKCHFYRSKPSNFIGITIISRWERLRWDEDLFSRFPFVQLDLPNISLPTHTQKWIPIQKTTIKPFFILYHPPFVGGSSGVIQPQKNTTRTGTIWHLWHYPRIGPSTLQSLGACMSDWLHFYFPSITRDRTWVFSTIAAESRKTNQLLCLWYTLLDLGLWTTKGEVIH